MSFFQRGFTWVRSQPRLPDLLSFAGGLVYAAQSITYIFTSGSMLDEGLYLLKGWYFATGQYTPFEDYGVLTNHMPLAFLIPGYVLKWFGSTLLTGRIYAVILGLIALVALWWLARRLSGAWWAAFAVWAIALNVALVRIYSLALSQVLIAALLALVLLLSLRREPKLWHVLLAGFLCGALVMVRINMLPFAGLWLIYLFLLHGLRTSAIALGGFLFPLVVVHALYWPNILRLWVYWIPENWVPWLQQFYTPWDKFTSVNWNPGWSWLANLDDNNWNPIISFWQGLRFNFVVVVGVLLNLLFWPMHKSWPDRFSFRSAVFLNLSFVVLLLAHMWASLGGQSCHLFCFSGYIGFFTSLGLIAIVVTAPYWRRDLHWAHQLAIALVLLILAVGIGFGSGDNTGKFLAEFDIPRLSGGSFPLWGVFDNRFGTTYRDARKVIPALAGLALAAAVLVASLIYSGRKKAAGAAPAALLAFFVLGYALTPTPILSGGDETLQCGGNLPRAYNEIAAQLRPLIQPSETLYYHGPNSPAILFYLPPVQIYPPQLNNVFSFNDEDTEASTDELLRFGYWNQELKDEWAVEADLVLIEARRYAEWQPMVEVGELDIVLETGSVEPCRGQDSAILLLRRATP
ncbi:MAG: hypothetical protein WEC37_04005 [Anaerolineales bacterium]